MGTGRAKSLIFHGRTPRARRSFGWAGEASTSIRCVRSFADQAYHLSVDDGRARHGVGVLTGGETVEGGARDGVFAGLASRARTGIT